MSEPGKDGRDLGGTRFRKYHATDLRMVMQKRSEGSVHSCLAQAAMPSFPIVNHRGRDAVHFVTHGKWDKKRCLAEPPGWERAFRQKVVFWSQPYQEFRNKCEDEDRAGVR